MIDLNELKALAAAATPGPWLHRRDPGNPVGVQHGVKLDGEFGAWICDCLDNADRETSGGVAGERNAAFIAAANPAAVLELIALVKQPCGEQNARFAIDGAIAFGRMGVNKPPADDHWLMEYWMIGQQLAEFGKTGMDNVNPPDDDTTPAAPQSAPVLPVKGVSTGQPVAWIRRHPDGTLTRELLLDAVIEPVRKTSGAWVPLSATPLAQDPLALRAQGRAEALNIILDLDPETGLDDCCGSHALADTGDYSAHWDEVKLRELLHVEDATYAAFDKAEAAYWECMGERDEARHAAALAHNAPGCAKLRTYLIEQNQIGLLHELMTQEPFQARVQPWLLECFGADIAADRVERNHRFLEEALELVQTCGCTADEAHQLVDYVFGRDVGEPAQEMGGVMVTLAALCLAQGLDMAAAGEAELTRIWTKVEAIRAKQTAKPKYGPLPGPTPPPAGAACEICDGTRVAFGKRCECAATGGPP